VKAHRRARRQRGFLMIEVLITMFVLLIGLLGVVGLQARAQQAENDAYQRSQALMILRDMVDRLNANRVNAASYVTGTSGTSVMGTGSGKDCTAPTSTADIDLCAWSASLVGAAESIGGAACNVSTGQNCAGTMIAARGCITSPATDVYLIQVVWQGLSPTDKPPSSVACGSGSYGAEEQRRAVTSIVQIGNLASP
jgi:type IV pilus assembly protein PilV